MRNGGNVTCPFILEFKIGLWPSPIALKPSKESMDSHIICPTEFAKTKQLEHKKYHHGKKKLEGR